MKAWIGARAEAARAWLRERQEARQRQQTERAASGDLHGHGRFWLLNVPMAATICAAITEWYWALLFCIEATGHVDWNWETAIGSEQAASGAWNFAFAAHLPVLLGLLAATVPIVMLSMVWLPVQFSMRGSGRWRRGSIIAVGLLANILVIVSGTVVMNYNRQEQVREGLVVEQTAAQGRAAIDARIAAVQRELDRITDPSMTTNEARAARAGVTGWRTYVREAQADPGVPPADKQRIVRAMGSAEAADALRQRLEGLTVERATAAPEAASAANVTDTVGAEMNMFAQRIEVYRPPFIAIVCTLIGIFGTWWVIAMLERMNPVDVMRSGWADESHRIEDLRGKEIVDSDGNPKKPEPMAPYREKVYDADTHEELVKVKPREYWRRRGARKGKPTKVDIAPEIPPDEVGVDAYATGRVELPNGDGVMVTDAPLPAEEPLMTDDEAAALLAETELAVEPAIGDVNADQHANDSDEPDAESEYSEPQTDPRRLIAAE